MWYQYLKDNEAASAQADKDSAHARAMAVLTQRLTGVSVSKPRRRTAFNVWADNPDNEPVLAAALSEAIAKEKPTTAQMAALRTRITKQTFEKQPAAVQAEFENASHIEHKEAIALWKELTNGKPSEKLEDIQAYVLLQISFVELTI
jgi:hypothetical protein